MQTEFFLLTSSDFKGVGEFEDIVETGEELNLQGDHWRWLVRRGEHQANERTAINGR